MNKSIITAFTALVLLVLTPLLGAGSVAQGTPLKLQATQEATEPSELPPDTPVLEFDKPVAETLTSDNPTQLYTFKGKANQLVMLSLTPKSGDFYTIVMLLDSSLQHTIGSTNGEALVGGSLIMKLPADDTYVVSIEYGDATSATPTPGSFDLLLTEFKPKP